MTLRVASFFAGIGGFDLGFERAGMEVVWQCEVNPFCRKILAQHWPDVPRASDITKVSADEIPDADVWVGGFPCQDVSVARMGPRSGLRGKRSGLFYDYAALIERRRPLLSLSKTYQVSSLPTKGETSESLFKRWPTSGMAWHGECLTAATSESPNLAKESLLLPLIETRDLPEKYF